MGLLLFFIFILLTIQLPLVRCQEVVVPPTASPGGGEWHLLNDNVGVSAMHMQLLHNNKVVMFDRTGFGPSNLSLAVGSCTAPPRPDCTAHSVLYDIGTNTIQPLVLQSDTFCSSGAVLPDGTLLQIGGFGDGDRTVRTLAPCATNDCDWFEYPSFLSERRWYSTSQILPDGRVIIIGGRRQVSYEFYPRNSGDTWSYLFSFLRDTKDDNEDNLYPFVHLLPDGNLFIFANTQSISFDYKNSKVVREFPSIPGGDPRNYPSSGSSVLLPIRISSDSTQSVEAEVLVCGGAPRSSFPGAGQGNFMRALSTCGRLRVTDENPYWVTEEMPMQRVMGDMLLLPTGDVIIINGARSGTAGWELGRDPVTVPWIYRTHKSFNRRFSRMNPSKTPRMYHSSAVLIPDGRILVGGSNPHINYTFSNVQFPTELSLEAFSPPYLAPEYDQIRPRITSCSETISYGEILSVTFGVLEYKSVSTISVALIAPPFTTHSLAMNQRLVSLRVMAVRGLGIWTYELSAFGPPTAEVAPRGYYLLFVVHKGTPSSGRWVKVQ